MIKSVVGIICEYDPFHLGHRRQFELIRRQLPDAKIVCLMSGCFTQRGMPALHQPLERARAALKAGADVVFELPCAFAVRDAEHFALGGVEIFSRLGFVTHLSFGTEGDIRPLTQAAELLENPSDAFCSALQTALQAGSSFASAQGEALAKCLPDGKEMWDQPNNILGISYLRAMLRTGSRLQVLPVRREGSYHAAELSAQEWPSATAVRKAFLCRMHDQASAACGWELPHSPVCKPEALDPILLYRLRFSSARQLSLLPDCTEGLENRLAACAAECTSREQLLQALKTKRYARARLNRLCCHALLDMTQDFLDDHPIPEYVRLLGLKRGCADLTKLFRESSLPIISKAADADLTSPLLQLDQKAYDLWALGAGLPAGLMLRQGVCIV